MLIRDNQEFIINYSLYYQYITYVYSLQQYKVYSIVQGIIQGVSKRTPIFKNLQLGNGDR